MKILMIDNYDSFTYNLVHYMESNPYGVEIMVKTPDLLHEVSAGPENIIGIIISPGPSHPADRQDVIDFVSRHWGLLPIFGICLGHQMLWHMTGGKVIRGERPVHGHTYDISHTGKFIFEDVGMPLTVTRYHSLVCAGESSEFEITAKSDDGVNMAIQHVKYPIYGVQYHPEAILSSDGRKQLFNFINIALEA
ncbi:anthranilate synthase component 2/para-aminobenzoate synthetase component 2 [Salinicoccus kekensis]|uniref:Anthranilate synthase component 2/para-aminobenzoate synthetase component 2 n=2 Tax=Salinicoccus kekensis TaxID=714307 RepID=A0A285UW17_9STAP|nr:anthranilate synthase component 2/para-aminobenzoate synthetase component 2 [Salinicoccus kekensis]